MRRLLLATAFVVAARIVVACTSIEEPLAPPEVERDASSDAPPSPPSDAGYDAPVGRDADAGLRCTADGWCHTHLPIAAILDGGNVDPERPLSIDLRDLWVGTDHEAWAVSREGYVLRWKDESWQLAFDARTPLLSVWAESPTRIWIAGEKGLVMRGEVTASGVVFVPIGLPSSEPVQRIRGTSLAGVWAITPSAIWRASAEDVFESVPFPNGIEDPSAAQELGTIWVAGAELWFGGREYMNCDPGDCNFVGRALLARFRGDDGGASSWERVPLVHPALTSGRFDYHAIAGGASADGLQLVNLVGFRSNVVARVGGAAMLDASASVEAGALQMTVESSSPWGTAEAIWAASKDDIWVVGSPGVVRHWDGTSWVVGRIAVGGSPITQKLHAVSGVRDANGKTDVWIVGEGLAMHRSELP